LSFSSVVGGTTFFGFNAWSIKALASVSTLALIEAVTVGTLLAGWILHGSLRFANVISPFRQRPHFCLDTAQFFLIIRYKVDSSFRQSFSGYSTLQEHRNCRNLLTISHHW
jgi:hypothetical protein